MSLIKIPGTNLIRDTKSMALINNDNTEKNEYYSKSRVIKSQKDEINSVKSEITDVKNEMQEIKQLLVQLLGKGSNG